MLNKVFPKVSIVKLTNKTDDDPKAASTWAEEANQSFRPTFTINHQVMKLHFLVLVQYFEFYFF